MDALIRIEVRMDCDGFEVIVPDEFGLEWARDLPNALGSASWYIEQILADLSNLASAEVA
jgi:hypothetical protein